MSRHLGDLAAAFVDDQLDPLDRARATAHLDGCPRCTAEVQAQRQVKERLAGLRRPAAPAALAARLLAIPATSRSQGAAPVTGHAAGHSAAASPAVPRPVAPGSRPPGRPGAPAGPASSQRPVRRRGIRVLVLSGASAVVVCLVLFGLAFAVGDTTSHAPPVAPPMAAYVADHASVSNDVPLTDPALTTVTSRVLP